MNNLVHERNIGGLRRFLQVTPKLLVERKKWSGKLAHIPPLEGDNPDRRIVWPGRRTASKKKPGARPGRQSEEEWRPEPGRQGGIIPGAPRH